MSEDFDKYLAIANHDIQMAKDMGELKSYVASLLYDNDKKVDMIHELLEEIERLNNIIAEGTYCGLFIEIEDILKGSDE